MRNVIGWQMLPWCNIGDSISRHEDQIWQESWQTSFYDSWKSISGTMSCRHRLCTLISVSDIESSTFHSKNLQWSKKALFSMFERRCWVFNWRSFSSLTLCLIHRDGKNRKLVKKSGHTSSSISFSSIIHHSSPLEIMIHVKLRMLFHECFECYWWSCHSFMMIQSVWYYISENELNIFTQFDSTLKNATST